MHPDEHARLMEMEEEETAQKVELRGDYEKQDSPPSLTLLRDEAYRIAKEHGWHDPDIVASFGDRVALMHSELSEALEDFRAGHAPNEVWYERKVKVGGVETVEKIDRLTYCLLMKEDFEGTSRAWKPCGIPSELADLVIRVLDSCGAYGIDIQTAVLDKMAFNEGRPYRHGNKKL